VVEGDRRVVLDLDLTDSTQVATPMLDGDRVTLVAADSEREEVVHLSGWVKYAGVYGYQPGMRVSELLRQGEALRKESYLPRAVIRRPLADGTHRLIPIDLSSALGNDLRRGARPFSEGLLAGDGVHLGSLERTDPPSYGTPSNVVADPVLQSRDVLHVYSAREMGWQHFVTIQDQVKAPGRYELARNMKLSDLIFEAGGLLPGADLSQAELVRLNEDGTSETFIINLERLLVDCAPDEDLKLKKDDAVFVRRVPDRLASEKVLIEGEVRFPGHYSLTRRGEPLSEVLERAGGVTDYAFADGAVFTRDSINEHIERQNVLPVFMSFRADSVTGIPMRAAPWLDGLEPDLLPSNRMAIDLPRLLETDGRSGDVPMRDGDRLHIPRRPSGIAVIGHVAAAGTMQYRRGKSVGYYLDRAGGITHSGDKGGLRVVRANGEVERCDRGERIRMGDSIVIPPKQRRPRDWRWLHSTLGMLGGAAATALIINQVD
jgi:protein involved in polysaccharide export with SLBB domain